MAGVKTMLFGDDSAAKRAQKALEEEQKKAAADALAAKVTSIQGDVGSRTRDLVARYGVAGGPTL
jgi:hypothetical protein